MMQKSDYLPYFNLADGNIFKRTFFAVTHFFHQAKSWASGLNYHKILQDEDSSGRPGGRLLLGPLPIDAYVPDLLRELSPKGLIVACNPCHELASSGAAIPTTFPFIWEQVGIEHHHLHFQYAEQMNPSLILETLAKMQKVYKEGGTVYVHCKANRFRSSFILVLFMSMIDLNLHSLNEVELQELLVKNLARLPRENTWEKAMLNLGVEVLKQLRNGFLKEQAVQQEKVYTQSPEFYARLTQSPTFKALWHFGFNNAQYLDEIQIIIAELYRDPLEIWAALQDLTKSDSAAGKACQIINAHKDGSELICQLKNFLSRNQIPNCPRHPTELELAYENFNKSLVNYLKTRPDLPVIQQQAVIHAARQLQSSILLSQAPAKDKQIWLDKTSQFFDNPDVFAAAYYQDANSAVLSDDPYIRELGKKMLYLGAFVLTAILIAGIVAADIFSLPVVIGIGVTCLAFMAAARYVMSLAAEKKVRDYSRELITQILPEF